MIQEIIHTDKAPKAVGPYSQAVKIGDLIFVAGQLPVDPDTGEIVRGDIRHQTKQVLLNVEAVLAAAGGTLGHVVKTTVFLTDMKDFADMNETYAEFFKDRPPARACIEVAALPRGVSIEIEAVASL